VAEDKNLENKLKQIKLVVFDVDGVLTSGNITYDYQGRTIKSFNVKDGLGISLLSYVGIKTAIATAKKSKVVHLRAQDMNIDKVYAGIMPKESLIEHLKSRYKVNSDQICFMGDDLIDIGLMRKVGVPIAVADAVSEVREEACYVTKAKGGQGAAREVVQMILKAKGLWGKALDYCINYK
jgi:3-deoxy-D-manno-octulosonate 8-phosphate phosphatase (KDO 8-P phosphatase)